MKTTVTLVCVSCGKPLHLEADISSPATLKQVCTQNGWQLNDDMTVVCSSACKCSD